MNELGAHVRAIRGERSLREFAQQCDGLSHTQLDAIEKGYDPRTGKPVNLTWETLRKLAIGCKEKISVLAALAANEGNEEIIISAEISKIYNSLSDGARKRLLTYGDDLLSNPANIKSKPQK